MDRPRQLDRLTDRLGASRPAGRGERETRSVERGVAWLAATQQADGSWDEPHFTGTGFPWDFSINYHLYRQVFPLTALGRYVYGDPFATATAIGAGTGKGA